MSLPWVQVSTHDGHYRVHTGADQVLVALGTLPESNREYVAFLVTSWVALLADSPLSTVLSTPAGGKPWRLFRDFHSYLLSTPISDVISGYSSLAQEIMTQCHIYGEGSTTGPFLDQMKTTPVFKEYLTWFRTSDVACLRFVLTFLLFGKKAEFQDPKLEPDALRKWLDIEAGLSNLMLEPQILQDLRFIISLALPPVSPLPFMGKNGPGTIAGGGRATSTKLNKLTYDRRLDRAFFLSVGHTARQERLAHDPVCVIPNHEDWVLARSDRTRSHDRCPAELLFVPKTVSSMRSICREPANMMYFQQALRYELEESIRQGFLSSFINIKDQTENQASCVAGSAAGLIDTLDLSSASDSVSLELVKAIFPRHFLGRMLATRSGDVQLPDKAQTIVHIKKFGPMGSAVTFPTQCIIYTSVGIRAYLRKALGPKWREVVRSVEDLRNFFGGKTFREPTFSVSRLQPLRVYGDDILCDSNVSQDIIHDLVSLGFKVNEDKSFRSSQAFRESCGTYAWCGSDVSPLRFKVKFFARTLSMSAATSLIDFANLAGDRGLSHLRSAIINMVLRHPLEGPTRNKRIGARNDTNQFKFVSNRNEFGIYTTVPESGRNKHLRSRRYVGQVDSTTCSTYQRDEVRHIVLKAQLSADDSYIRHRFEYAQWWVSAYHSVDSNDREGRIGWYDVLRGAEVGWGWTPTS